MRCRCHPWKIILTNVYVYTDPDVPVYTSSSAIVDPNSLVFQGMGSYSSVHTVIGACDCSGPTNGTYLYLSGTVNASGGVTGITLTSGVSLPSRVVFSGVFQTTFACVIGRFLQLGDGSFVNDQWVSNNLTMIDFCGANLGFLISMRDF